MKEKIKVKVIKLIWLFSNKVSKKLKISNNNSHGLDNTDYDQYIAKEVIDILHLEPNQKILDIGCGKGIIADILSEKYMKIVGIDFVNNILNKSKKYNFIQSNCLNLCLKNNSYSTVFSYSMIHYLSKDMLKTFFNELKRIVKPNGKVLLAEIPEKKKYFNKYIYAVKCNVLKKILMYIYLNFFYQYFIHKKEDLISLANEFGFSFKFFKQDSNLPYSYAMYHILLEKK